MTHKRCNKEEEDHQETETTEIQIEVTKGDLIKGKLQDVNRQLERWAKTGDKVDIQKGIRSLVVEEVLKSL